MTAMGRMVPSCVRFQYEEPGCPGDLLLVSWNFDRQRMLVNYGHRTPGYHYHRFTGFHGRAGFDLTETGRLRLSLRFDAYSSPRHPFRNLIHYTFVQSQNDTRCYVGFGPERERIVLKWLGWSFVRPWHFQRPLANLPDIEGYELVDIEDSADIELV